MATCTLCSAQSELVSRSLGLYNACILADTPNARAQAEAAHFRSRQRFQLPARPPKATNAAQWRRCLNACCIADGGVGYCGVRYGEGGQIKGGDAESAAVQWYHDPLPTNCVAVWVCSACGEAGYPEFTDARGPEHGYTNLAVFYEACSFDCPFCQKWHFKEHSLDGPRRSAAELADAVDSTTRCICFFGGDPSCQVEHAVAAARLEERNLPFVNVQ